MRLTIHFMDGEVIEATAAGNVETAGFPVTPDGGGNNTRIWIGESAYKYLVIHDSSAEPSPGSDVREGKHPRVVVHFLDGETLRTYDDGFLGPVEGGFTARLWREGRLVPCLISRRAMKGAFHVRTWDSRAEEERVDWMPAAAGTSARAPRESRSTFADVGVHENMQGVAKEYRWRLTQVSHEGLASRDPEVFRRAVEECVPELLRKDQRWMDAGQFQALVDTIVHQSLGYGLLDRLLADPSVSDVMVNGADEVWVERRGRIERAEGTFRDEAELLEVIRKMAGVAGRRIDTSNPMVDARLPDGSRINAIIPPAALRGPMLTIRKFSSSLGSLRELVKAETLNPEMAAFLNLAVTSRLNILISGGTGSGKTTTLNALAGVIPLDHRVITIEDTAELQIPHPHVLSLESRQVNVEGRGELTIRDLLRNALRMRPDRIIVGECRGAETLDMLQAMNTGHQGSMSTIHANSARDAFSRLETMALSASIDLPLVAVRQQVASAIHLVVHQARLADGSRRMVQISELTGYGDQGPVLEPVFSFDANSASFTFHGHVPASLESCALPILGRRRESGGGAAGRMAGGRPAAG